MIAGYPIEVIRTSNNAVQSAQIQPRVSPKDEENPNDSEIDQDIDNESAED
jgi:hypothetical protein